MYIPVGRRQEMANK